jgi:hypothetical protein
MPIDTYNRKARFTQLKLYDLFAKDDDFMEVCEWHNGEGFDVTINDRVVSFTWGQWECLLVLVNYKGSL